MADSDTEPLRAAFDRQEQRRLAAKQAADDFEWKRQQKLKPPMSPAEIKSNAQVARQLVTNERLAKKIDNLLQRDYAKYFEHGMSEKYLHLISTD
jgi:hypothetical protein